MKYTALLILLISLSIFGQEKDDVFFERIIEAARPAASQIKRGDVEMFKDVNTSQKFWTYQDLKRYKDSLNADKFILKGHFIMPSATNENLYSYCEYALHSYNDKYTYYYAVAISVDTKNGNFTVDKEYLFTKDKALAVWWNSVFNFFETDLRNLVPSKFIDPNIPPPPPQNFLSTKF